MEWKPIHFAAATRSVEAVKVLAHHGADVYAVTEQAVSGLDLGLINFLLAAGAKPNPPCYSRQFHVHPVRELRKW